MCTLRTRSWFSLLLFNLLFTPSLLTAEESRNEQRRGIADQTKELQLAQTLFTAFFADCEGKNEQAQQVLSEACEEKLVRTLRQEAPGSDHPLIRLRAIRELSDRHLTSDTIVALLADTLGDTDGVVRSAAGRLLAKLKPENLSLSRPYLEHPDPSIRWTAVSALERSSSEESRLMLTRLLQDTNLRVQANSASTLRAMNSTEAATALEQFASKNGPSIRRLLSSSDKIERDAAVSLVQTLHLTEAIPELLQRMSQKDHFAALAIATLAPQSIPPLLEMLGSGTVDEKEGVVTALAFVKPTSESILNALEAAHSNNASLSLKIMIQATLKKIGSKEALAILHRLQNQLS